MKQFFFIILFLLNTYGSFAQTITNVVATQNGNNVKITYNLKCDFVARVDLYISEDGGTNFTGPLKSVTGDVGYAIKSGKNTIIWNVLKDRDIIVDDSIVFQVKANNTDRMQDSRDGRTYKIVKIGNQIWMAENLAYKANSGCWAYDNDQSNVRQYGYLYDWETAKNVCPDGWHLPADYEWKQLEMHLGMSNKKANKEGWRGNEGKQLKSTYGWKKNKKANNKSGFSALPGGYRHNNNGSFGNVGLAGYWWSATPNGSSTDWSRDLRSSNAEVSRYAVGNSHGFSVRCIKNRL